jgi:lipoyl(octanoyl) transferase
VVGIQPRVLIRELGCMDYHQAWNAMQAFSQARDTDTPDEIWLLEHSPTYTLGLKCPIPDAQARNGIPVVKTDRGGDITYHGPGQAIIYLMIDLQRRGLSVRQLVGHMEQAVIDLLAPHGVTGQRHKGAPGVYVNGVKLASLGLRVRRGCTYHGLALNVNMDLTPFQEIDPCGLAGMAVTQLADLHINLNVAQAGRLLAQALASTLEGARPYGNSTHHPENAVLTQ